MYNETRPLLCCAGVSYRSVSLKRSACSLPRLCLEGFLLSLLKGAGSVAQGFWFLRGPGMDLWFPRGPGHRPAIGAPPKKKLTGQPGDAFRGGLGLGAGDAKILV